MSNKKRSQTKFHSPLVAVLQLRCVHNSIYSRGDAVNKRTKIEITIDKVKWMAMCLFSVCSKWFYLSMFFIKTILYNEIFFFREPFVRFFVGDLSGDDSLDDKLSVAPLLTDDIGRSDSSLSVLATIALLLLLLRKCCRQDGPGTGSSWRTTNGASGGIVARTSTKFRIVDRRNTIFCDALFATNPTWFCAVSNKNTESTSKCKRDYLNKSNRMKIELNQNVKKSYHFSVRCCYRFRW